ncbi:MAG: vitamin B12-dependent ribonucleotide reductase [Candidatus Nanoarchaeia archaeon]
MHNLNVNALTVLDRRYLLKDKEGKVIETPEKMFRRVARNIAKADAKYYSKKDVKKIEKEFFGIMSNLEFLPNSPTLMNAGTRIGQLSACYVIPVHDSIKDIFEAVKTMAVVHQSGGGTGFDFSKLRPKGEIVKSTRGVASGPISFMRVFDVTTDVIKQGGRRRGANMGILRVDHPDIMEFIKAKENQKEFTNFNLSVAVTDKFMKDVVRGKKYPLINPLTKKTEKWLNAREVFNEIVKAAWKTGDPGLIFLDEINRKNPLPKLGLIEATNPCGEQPLLPYESCNLGSINLPMMVDCGKINWKKLKRTVRIAVHFLDNVIDVNKYPLKKIKVMTQANRKIGLGVMGFAEMLIKLKIPYDSPKAVRLAEKTMRFIQTEAKKASRQLARKKGAFPNIKKSKLKGMRNATVTTIAPTGSISIIAGTSSGIEPLFAVAFVRNILDGTQMLEVNPLFIKMAEEKGILNKKLLIDIAKRGSIQHIKKIPKDMKKIFVTALDIKPEWHIKMQAAFQKYTDNAVSKTINFPKTATIKDVKKAYLLAYKMRCKGITIFKYGSKEEQVLYFGKKIKLKRLRFMGAEPEFSGGCPYPFCPH